MFKGTRNRIFCFYFDFHELNFNCARAATFIQDPDAVRCFFFHARPQFLGSLVELREWDLLSLFVRYLGSAEGKRYSPSVYSLPTQLTSSLTKS